MEKLALGVGVGALEGVKWLSKLRLTGKEVGATGVPEGVGTALEEEGTGALGAQSPN